MTSCYHFETFLQFLVWCYFYFFLREMLLLPNCLGCVCITLCKSAPITNHKPICTSSLICASTYHRITNIFSWKAFWGHLIKFSSENRGNLKARDILLTILSRWILTTSRIGGFTTSLSISARATNPYSHCDEFFPLSSWSISGCNSWPMPLALLLQK